MAIDDGSQLPEKESIAPNQHTWPETAAQMGEKRGTKHSRGKVDSALMAQHIGEPNRKHMTDNDLYGAEEQSGKRAKPDARSANANAQACKAAEREALKAEPPLPPASQPLPTLLPLPPMLPLLASQPFRVMPTMHAPTMYNHPFQPPLAPLSQPMYSHSQGAPSLAPPYYPAFNFPTYTYSHQM